MLIEFTEWNTSKVIYVAHDDVLRVRSIANADRGASLSLRWSNDQDIFVQESPYDVACKLNAAEKLVESY